MTIIARTAKESIKSAHFEVLPVFSDSLKTQGFPSSFSQLTYKRLSEAQQFEAKPGQTLLIPNTEIDDSVYVVIGLGETSKLNEETLRSAFGAVFQLSRQVGFELARIDVSAFPSTVLSLQTSVKAMSEGMLYASYVFTEYKVDKRKSLKKLFIESKNSSVIASMKKGIQEAERLHTGVSLARDLVNKPGNEMTPMILAGVAETIAKESKGMVKTKIYKKDWAKKKKMGAYLAVAQGAHEEPAFIHLVYKPKKKAKRVIAIVGKGVTFDSGGLSLKPAQYMETMKCDMAGAGAVLGLFAILKDLQPAIEIHGIIAATENMPGANAIRPGDVIRAANGKTIEILNTDAEGRLTLADAFSFAGEQKPEIMIDLATLTGACVVALGDAYAGVMGNDDALQNEIVEASVHAGEPCWKLPMHDGYIESMKSDIADIRNISRSRYGGTISAALFLKEFVPEGVKWAHLDIAGPAFAERPLTSYLGVGATGFGIRTLVNYINTL